MFHLASGRWQAEAQISLLQLFLGQMLNAAARGWLQSAGGVCLIPTGRRAGDTCSGVARPLSNCELMQLQKQLRLFQ